MHPSPPYKVNRPGAVHNGVISLASFLVASGLIVWVIRRQHHILDRLRCTSSELERERAQLADIYQHVPVALYSLNQAGQFVDANQRLSEWLGVPRSALIAGMRPVDFFNESGVAEFKVNYPIFLAQGHIGPLEFDLIGRTGQVRRVIVHATAVKAPDGSFCHSRSVMFDITDLYQAQQAITQAHRTQEAMLNSELIGTVRLRNRHAVWTNAVFERMFDYSHGEMQGTSARIIYPDDAAYEALGQAAYPVLGRGGTYRTQLQLAKKDGTLFWADMSGAMVSADPPESVWMLIDITEQKTREVAVTQMAFHDALTGLPNRLLLIDRLQKAIPLQQRMQNWLALCFIDLDGFKAVNDTQGHDAGDAVLKVVAQRLQDCVRGNDTVARLGGDEFVVVLTHLQSPEEGMSIVERIRVAVAMPVETGVQSEGRVAASIGVAWCPTDGYTVDELMACADRRMYEVKRQRKFETMVAESEWGMNLTLS